MLYVNYISIKLGWKLEKIRNRNIRKILKETIINLLSKKRTENEFVK